MVSNNTPWEKRIGKQRQWVWRGWPIRYTYLLPSGQTEQQTKPPLILLHGFGAAIEHWRHNIPILAQEYPIYALDLLGFGGSKKAATDYNMYLWAEQVHDFWLTFIDQPVILVGNSIGALLCVTVAERYPEMVAAMVMISLPDVSFRQKTIPSWLRPIVNGIEGLFSPPLLLKSLFNIIRRPQIIRPWIKLAYYDTSAITDELLDIIIIPPQDEGAARTFCLLFEGVKGADYGPSVQAVLPKLTMPMLLVWGLQDRFIPPSLAPIFAQLNPNITLVELDHAGHCLHDECPDKFNTILLDWMKKL